ncbi:TPA: DUF3085 domain-containing protein [Enterobacter hormaechei subsp. hoffmannii]|nr:DUF3085 domain-containing protein [Enterobacter hormaechei subsp. hoffmannii]
MSRLTFEISGVKKLLKEIQSAEQFLATVDQLFEPTNYPGGGPLNEAGKTEKEACLAGEVFWPSPKHMVQTRLTPQITLVKGHGVCLITNASLDGSPVSRDTAIYARGMNPSLDEDWNYESDQIMGGDDSTVTVPLEWFELAIEKKLKAFSLKVSPTKITLVNG